MASTNLQPNQNPLWAQNKPKDKIGPKYTLDSDETQKNLEQSDHWVRLSKEQLQDIHQTWNEYLGVNRVEERISESSHESKLKIGESTEIVFGQISVKESVKETAFESPQEVKDKYIPDTITSHEPGVVGMTLEFTKEGLEKIITADTVKEGIDAGKKVTRIWGDLFMYFLSGDLKYLKEFGVTEESEKKPKDNSTSTSQKPKPPRSFNWIARGVLGAGEKIALGLKRSEINAKLKIGNLNYENVMGEDGQIRIDVMAALDRANSELNQKELQKKRELQVSKATKKGKDLSMNLNAQEGNSKVANQIMGAG